MNESDIYAMARKAGAATDVGTGEWLMTFEELVSFAYTLIAHEREACAKVCYEYAQNAFNNSSQNAAMELRDMIRSGAKHDTRV